MARQEINTGAVPNDGTGDSIREAFDKTNDNFIELYSSVITYNYITSDFMLPDSSTFEGVTVVVNVGSSTYNVNTQTLDKLNGEDTQEIYPDESFQIVKEATNKYRII